MELLVLLSEGGNALVGKFVTDVFVYWGDYYVVYWGFPALLVFDVDLDVEKLFFFFSF